MTMVTDTRAVEDVVLGARGIASGARSGSVDPDALAGQLGLHALDRDVGEFAVVVDALCCRDAGAHIVIHAIVDLMQGTIVDPDYDPRMTGIADPPGKGE